MAKEVEFALHIAYNLVNVVLVLVMGGVVFVVVQVSMLEIITCMIFLNIFNRLTV